jgi:hypothetical protein
MPVGPHSEISGSAALQPHDIYDSDSDSSNDSDFDSFHSTVHENDLFQVDDDVDLASQVLKNMLITPDPSAVVKANPAPEQSFKGEGEAIDWDF